MIVKVVLSSLYNSIVSHTKTFHDILHLFEELALYVGGPYS